MDRKILAETLLEIARNSKTEIIESADNKELIEAAKKIGIVVPSPDLAVFKTIYAEIDKVNRNGVVLPRKAVEKGLPTLIGKQINWEHRGATQICGYIIDAKIEKDKVEIIGVVFKSLFPEEFEQVKEKFLKGTLAVSFEIWNKNPATGKSVIKDLGNGYREVDPIIFHGCGLLLTSTPACPKAKVYKLLAKEIIEAEKIVEKIFNEDLVYAELAMEEPKCKNCTICLCEKEEPKVELYELMVAEQSIEIKEEEIVSFENDYDGGEIEEAKRLTYEEKKNLPDEDFALVITVKNKVTGEPRKIRMFVINDEAHVRNALARLGQEKVKETLKRLGVSIETVKNKILKKAKELNMTDLLERQEKSTEIKPEETTVTPEVKPEETAEVKPEETNVEPEVKPEEKAQVEQPVEAPKVVKIVREESYFTTETPKEDGSGYTVERKGHTKRTTYFSDGKESVSEEDFEVVDKYTMAEVEELVESAAPKEVIDRVKELIKEGKSMKEALKQAWDEYKKKTEKASEEKDTEIANLKQELDKKNQEIEKAKVEKPEDTQPELVVGDVTQKDTNYYKGKRDSIDKKAFGQIK
jgi:hypothetical protein